MKGSGEEPEMMSETDVLCTTLASSSFTKLQTQHLSGSSQTAGFLEAKSAVRFRLPARCWIST